MRWDTLRSLKKIASILIISIAISNGLLALPPDECALSDCVMDNRTLSCSMVECVFSNGTSHSCDLASDTVMVLSNCTLTKGIPASLVACSDIGGILGWIYLGARALFKATCCKPSLREERMRGYFQRILSAELLSFIITTPSAIYLFYNLISGAPHGLDTFLAGIGPMLVGGIQFGYDIFKIVGWGLKKCGRGLYHQFGNKWFGIGKKPAAMQVGETRTYIEKTSSDIDELLMEKFSSHASLVQLDVLGGQALSDAKVASYCSRLLSGKERLDDIRQAMTDDNITLKDLITSGMNLDQLMKAGAIPNELSAAIAEALPLIQARVNQNPALIEEDDGGSIYSLRRYEYE